MKCPICNINMYNGKCSSCGYTYIKNRDINMNMHETILNDCNHDHIINENPTNYTINECKHDEEEHNLNKLNVDHMNVSPEAVADIKNGGSLLLFSFIFLFFFPLASLIMSIIGYSKYKKLETFFKVMVFLSFVFLAFNLLPVIWIIKEIIRI